MSRWRSEINIDLYALERNIQLIRGSILEADVCAVVKANAYGHGALPIAKKLCEIGISWFAVSSILEAVDLREGGVNDQNILIFGSGFLNELDTIRRYRLTPVIHSEECLVTVTKNLTSELKVHLELDTGMGRTGLQQADMARAIQEVRKNPYLVIDGVFTHFACADNPQSLFTQNQLELFENTIEKLANSGISPRYVHAANSPGILTTESKFNLVRPGLLMYGVSPYPQNEMLVRPVLTWKTKPCQLKMLPVGESISYGHTWTAKRKTMIAVIPVGYADGYPRIASNKGFVLVGNHKTPIVGNICMDYMMLDITDCIGVTLDTTITLVGSHGGEEISLNDIATWSDTIPYEVMCNVGKRSKFIFIDGERE